MVVLRQLRDAGLKVNADKSTFCALGIEYLGYVLTEDGIKPQSNKVQAIRVIQPPKRVKQLRLRHFLGMVQYYRDLWDGKDGATYSPLSPHWLKNVVRPKSPKQKDPKRYPCTGMRSIKENLITYKL